MLFRSDELVMRIERAMITNRWFTRDSIVFALKNISNQLTSGGLFSWVANYDFPNRYRVGVIMAGNIPLVGFHDFLSVLISGNKLVAKLSSEDDVLIPFLAEKLIAIEPKFAELIELSKDRLSKDIDLVIATGSDNSARYFEYYFSKYPRIIRKNRTSIAILNGDESLNVLKLLGKDIFTYYGLGCRNVSKIFIPIGYELNNIFEAIIDFQIVIDHNKYANNYTYHRALMLMEIGRAHV